jgi:hypothetical protein
MVRRWIVVVAATLALGACSKSDPVADYCAVVNRTHGAMIGSNAADLAAAASDRYNAAPPDIKADWSNVMTAMLHPNGDDTAAKASQLKITAFDKAHCGVDDLGPPD